MPRTKNSTPFKLTHGMSGTRVHRIWKAMIQRCTNPKLACFNRYSKLGMAAEFRDFAVFYAHLGDPPRGFSLDRIDNERGYFPGNVRWADRTTQARNSRRNHIVSFNGISKPIAAWSEDVGISEGLLYV